MRAPFSHALLPVFLGALFLGTSLFACQSCQPKPNGSKTPDPGTPAIRLYLLSDVAGALEPCGCVKDQLGGLDHAAAWMVKERGGAKASAVVSAGPLFFLDPTLKDDKRAQEIKKAETLARSLKGLDLVAFSPGRNDWAGGLDVLSDLTQKSGAGLCIANTTAQAPIRASLIREMGGIKVGFIGVATPDKFTEGASLGAMAFGVPADAVKDEAAKLVTQGAQLTIAIASVGRGEAKRIADLAPQLTAIIVGSTGSTGEANTETPTAELVGNVLIAQTANHLQSVAVLDLFVRDASYAFLDGSGIDQESKRADLTRRIDDLRGRIASWERDGKANAADIAARKKDLEKLEADRKALDQKPAPDKGSFFRYTVQPIRDSLGRDDGVFNEMLAYYKHVNDANKAAFASKTPRPAENGNAYVGMGACVACHPAPKKVWDSTPHSHAYATLSAQFKEFNLDCVSCHVTGYDIPGGSTVTHVEGLMDVQCEVCHGPSSKHAKSPNKEHTPVPKPGPDRCLDCHHPPHVHTFDAKAKLADILGPGHGKPL